LLRKAPQDEVVEYIHRLYAQFMHGADGQRMPKSTMIFV
jgi:hypothetical protein